MAATARGGGNGADARIQSASPYWETMRDSGVVPLSPQSQLRLFTTLKDGQWYIRLRLYRRQDAGTAHRWLPSSAVMIVPVTAVDALREALEHAVTQVCSAGPARGGELPGEPPLAPA